VEDEEEDSRRKTTDGRNETNTGRKRPISETLPLTIQLSLSETPSSHHSPHPADLPMLQGFVLYWDRDDNNNADDERWRMAKKASVQRAGKQGNRKKGAGDDEEEEEAKVISR